MDKIIIYAPLIVGFLIAYIPAALAQSVSFESQVLPVFETKCSECHGLSNPEVRLTLISYEGVIKGSEYGIVIEPGEPIESYMIELIEKGEMPQDGEPVSPDELSLIKSWIEEGALNN